VARNPWGGKIKNLVGPGGVGNFAYHHELLDGGGVGCCLPTRRATRSGPSFHVVASLRLDFMGKHWSERTGPACRTGGGYCGTKTTRWWLVQPWWPGARPGGRFFLRRSFARRCTDGVSDDPAERGGVSRTVGADQGTRRLLILLVYGHHPPWAWDRVAAVVPSGGPHA